MRSRTRRSVAVATTVLLAGPLVALLAESAQATSTAPQASTSFAGYEVSVKATTTSATVVVPTITCKKSESGVGPAVLLDSKSGIFSGAGIAVACQKKTPIYQVVGAVNIGAPKSKQKQEFAVSPGDKITINVSATSASTKVTVDDSTSGDHKTLTGNGRVMDVAEVGVQGLAIGSASVGIDPFTPTEFSHALVNGRPLSKEGAIPMERKNGNTLQIAVSKLSKGRNFTATFKNS